MTTAPWIRWTGQAQAKGVHGDIWLYGHNGLDDWHYCFICMGATCQDRYGSKLVLLLKLWWCSFERWVSLRHLAWSMLNSFWEPFVLYLYIYNATLWNCHYGKLARDHTHTIVAISKNTLTKVHTTILMSHACAAITVERAHPWKGKVVSGEELFICPSFPKCRHLYLSFGSRSWHIWCNK